MHLAREPPALVLDAAVEAEREGLDLAERGLQFGGALRDGVLETGIRGNQRSLGLQAPAPLTLQQHPGSEDQHATDCRQQNVEEQRARPQFRQAAIAHLDPARSIALDAGEALADAIHGVAALVEALLPRRIFFRVGATRSAMLRSARRDAARRGSQRSRGGLAGWPSSGRRFERLVQDIPVSGTEIVLVAGEVHSPLAGFDILQRRHRLGREQEAGARARARIGGGVLRVRAGWHDGTTDQARATKRPRACRKDHRRQGLRHPRPPVIIGPMLRGGSPDSDIVEIGPVGAANGGDPWCRT